MAKMSFTERRLLERLFINAGYVLDFSDATFRQFFRDDVDVDIDDPKYESRGTSKGKRLRAFLELEDDATVACALHALWEYRKVSQGDQGAAKDEPQVMALIGKLSPTEVTAPSPAPVAVQDAGQNVTPTSEVVAAVVTAFASYAQIDEEYKARVLEVVQRLRRDGIDCYSDHFVIFPKQGWPAWTEEQVETRRWILVFTSETYKRRAEGKEAAGRGLGVIWEHGAIRRELYEAGRINERFVPVGFGDERRHVPADLREYTYFDLESSHDYERLLSVLRDEPLVTPDALGAPAPGARQHHGSTTADSPESASIDLPGAIQTGGAYVRQSSTVFFSDRFAQAFPGVRGTASFTPPVANERLAILLEAPLEFSSGERSWYEPIWIWTRGELAIQRFHVQPDGSALLNVEELNVDEVVAVNPGSYYQQFVYVQTRPSTPTGLYDYSYLSDIVSLRGTATEEFGIYDGHYITRAEFDDGAAVIDGKPVDVRGSSELRVRYLTPSNFLIAAQNSPINNKRFDSRRKDLLNGILRGDATLNDLVSAILDLPKREPMRYELTDDK